ncbi:hypothetical protein A6J33_000515 [Pantoea sp. FDAARGOS_194]|nr:hypothetical protein A6J33_000515 [Pantoea sp. FDAARGOS_194]RTY54674.1 hypothetical protein EKL29_19850 [Pantoea sp. YU22]
MVVANHHIILDTRARDGSGETYQNGTGFAVLPAPCSSCAICGCFWRLYAAKAAFRGRLRTARPPQGNNVRKIYSQLSLFCSDLWHCGGLLLPVVLHILTAVIAVILG